MKMMGAAAVVAMVGGGFYVHGPINQGELYPLPAAEALQRVQDVELPGRVKGMLFEAGATPSDNGTAIDRALVPGKSVIFTFKVQGKQVGTYTVSIDPADAASSRVSTDFEMAADASEHMKGIMMPMANQFRVVGAAMMTESVDAALDGRSYDKQVELAARSEYVATYPGEIMKGANDTMNKAATELNDLQKAPSHPNYNHSAQPMIVPGKPMVSPNPR